MRMRVRMHLRSRTYYAFTGKHGRHFRSWFGCAVHGSQATLKELCCIKGRSFTVSILKYRPVNQAILKCERWACFAKHIVHQFNACRSLTRARNHCFSRHQQIIIQITSVTWMVWDVPSLLKDQKVAFRSSCQNFVISSQCLWSPQFFLLWFQQLHLSITCKPKANSRHNWNFFWRENYQGNWKSP